jgi:GDP-4-dehydro-6-deoxy-D-mannose reductase
LGDDSLDGRAVSTRFFVTGAQGFVGRYVTAHLLTSRPDAEVLGVGRSSELRDTFPHSIRWASARLPAPLPTELELTSSHPAYHYASIDLNARVPLTRALRAFRPHVVIHLASALRDEAPIDLVRTNIEATRALMETVADAELDLRRLIICSTGGVYGAPGVSPLPFDETAACHPLDPYSASKLVAERLSQALAIRHGIETVGARLFNVVGAGEDDRHVGPEFARQVTEIRHGVRPPIVDVGDLQTTRDFIDVRDVAVALSTLVDHGTAGDTYNVATGTETSTRSLLDLVLETAGLQGSVEVRRRPTKGGGPSRHFADTRRLRALGWEPRFDLARSASDMVEYYMVRVTEAARSSVAGSNVAGGSMDFR